MPNFLTSDRKVIARGVGLIKKDMPLWMDILTVRRIQMPLFALHYLQEVLRLFLIKESDIKLIFLLRSPIPRCW